jgi:hypothetical protein
MTATAVRGRSGWPAVSSHPECTRDAAGHHADRAAATDVGGVEYMIDDRDGRAVFYDINALSNFVADAPRVIGFDPHIQLVDFLERQVRQEKTAAMR